MEDQELAYQLGEIVRFRPVTPTLFSDRQLELIGKRGKVIDIGRSSFFLDECPNYWAKYTVIIEGVEFAGFFDDEFEKLTPIEQLALVAE